MSDLLLILLVLLGVLSPIVVLSLIDRQFAIRRLETHNRRVSRISIFYPPDEAGKSLNFRKGGWLLEYIDPTGVTRKVFCGSGLCGRFRPFHRKWAEA